MDDTVILVILNKEKKVQTIMIQRHIRYWMFRVEMLDSL